MLIDNLFKGAGNTLLSFFKSSNYKNTDDFLGRQTMWRDNINLATSPQEAAVNTIGQSVDNITNMPVTVGKSYADTITKPLNELPEELNDMKNHYINTADKRLDSLNEKINGWKGEVRQLQDQRESIGLNKLETDKRRLDALYDRYAPEIGKLNAVDDIIRQRDAEIANIPQVSEKHRNKPRAQRYVDNMTKRINEEYAPRIKEGEEGLSIPRERIEGYQNKIQTNKESLSKARKEYGRTTHQINKAEAKIQVAEFDKGLYGLEASINTVADGASMSVGAGLESVGTTIGKATSDVMNYAVKPTVGAGVLAAAHVGDAVGDVVGVAARIGAGATVAGVQLGAAVGLPVAGAIGKLGFGLGKEAGMQVAGAAKFMWNTRDNRAMQMAIGAVGIGATGTAWDYGEKQASLSNKGSNLSLSSDNGGLLLHGGQAAPVTSGMKDNKVIGEHIQDYGASGDLVFALHNLRHGG